MQASPELHEVRLADLDRNIAQGRNVMGWDEERSRPIFADPELHAAEQQAMFARELTACIAGAA
ncbi:MAG: hypothetical protein WBD65_07320 [Methylocella sp.]